MYTVVQKCVSCPVPFPCVSLPSNLPSASTQVHTCSDLPAVRLIEQNPLKSHLVFPTCLSFRAFTNSFYWEREKGVTWNGNFSIPLSGQLFSWRVPRSSSSPIWSSLHTGSAGCRALWFRRLGNNFCLLGVQFSVGWSFFPCASSTRYANKLCGLGETKEASQCVPRGMRKSRHKKPLEGHCLAFGTTR